jgi:hypothetical protein
MPALHSGALSRLPATLALALLTLALFAACDNGNDGAPAIDTTTTAEATASSTEESLTLPSETGEEPVYWRTRDNFKTLRAGEPYKVVLRVTNGYDEETLGIAAFPEGSDDGLGITANRVEPVGAEGPGSFYVFDLELPRPGTWQVTVRVGGDEATITVEVKPAAGSTRY